MFNIHIVITEQHYNNDAAKNQYSMNETKTTIDNKTVLADIDDLDDWLEEAHITIIKFYRERGLINGNGS